MSLIVALLGNKCGAVGSDSISVSPQRERHGVSP